MEEVKIDDIIRLNEGAKEEILRILREENPENKQALRIGVKGGGCSGLSYILDLDNAGEGDISLNVDGVSLVVKEAHALYLHGLHLEYEKGLNNRGFVFINPNAKESCGCGTSFAI